MRFSIDFATGLVICDSCSSSMKVHVDDLENGKTYSTNFRNKECFKNFDLKDVGYQIR